MNEILGCTKIKIITEDQKLLLYSDSEIVKEYSISSSKKGLGSEIDSLKTPPGLHRIHSKIGAGEKKGTIFKSRKATEKVWDSEQSEDDLILSRILVLEGLEPGVNKGGNVDSLQRYIYIHGTNHENKIGLQASHGCIRMKNNDIMELFELVKDATEVEIV